MDGFRTAAARGHRVGATPPIGTPTAGSRPGNSAPALAPVAGLGKSPFFGPVRSGWSGVLLVAIGFGRVGSVLRGVT